MTDLHDTCAIPATPPARGYESSATATLRPRYEDITQDGRVQIHSLMPGLTAVWDTLDADDRLASFRERGVLPILRRIVMLGEPGPFSASVDLEYSGTWRLAREAGGERLFLNMWLDARAPRASTHGPTPPKDAERVLVGRVFAEHVMTRPFAPPAERKVTRLDAPGVPAVPEDEHPLLEAEALVTGRSLEPARDVAFGMMHTDSNQHVNSLVYPRLFEQAAVERAIARSLTPEPHHLLATAIELRYRKPFFAGERASLALHLEPAAAPHRARAAGAFSPAAPGPPRPSCTLAAWFR